MCARDHAERNRDEYRNYHREDGELDGCGIAFEDQIDNWPVVAERQTHVAVQQQAPVIGVAIVGAVPDKVSLAIVVAWKREEERRPIKTMLLAKLCKLFRCRLFTENGNRRITRHEFD